MQREEKEPLALRMMRRICGFSGWMNCLGTSVLTTPGFWQTTGKNVTTEESE
jgi:hypothetical protein